MRQSRNRNLLTAATASASAPPGRLASQTLPGESDVMITDGSGLLGYYQNGVLGLWMFLHE